MRKKIDYWITALITVLFMAVLLGLLRPIYYANDDAMLRSILSGSFSASESSKTVYFGQLLSLPISLLQRMLPAVSWFDWFQILCLGISFWFIFYRSVSRVSPVMYKILIGIFTCIFLAGILLHQMVLPTYTVTAAAGGCCGIFLLLTAQECTENKKQLLAFLPAILLLVLCFEIRQNVFFLALPFAAVAVFYRFLKRGNLKETLKRYLPSIGLFAGLIIVCLIAEAAGYHSGDWKTYKKYNEARTLIYDYSGIDTSEKAMQRYHELGISDETISLYQNYNILLAKQQDPETMEAVAAEQPPYGTGWKKAVYSYVYRFLRETGDYPYSALAIAFYVVLIFMLWPAGRKKDLLMLCCLAVVRSGLWVYLMEQGRYPQRITVSLYLLEFAVLFGLFFEILLEYGRDLKKQKSVRKAMITYSAAGILFLMFLITAVTEMKTTSEQYKETTDIYNSYSGIFDYMERHPENLYLLDVASFNNCPEYLFQKNAEMDNYLLLGGWMTGSPLLADKLSYYGYSSAREAFFKGNNVYYVSKNPKTGLSELEDIEIKMYDYISNGQDTFYILEAGLVGK